MSENTTRKTMNIPMEESLYSRAFCKKMAKEIAQNNQISGMSLDQLSVEIFAHAYIYYNFRLVPKFLKENKIFKSLYRSVSNGVDLEDNGDKWYRRIAYRFIWMLPAFAIC